MGLSGKRIRVDLEPESDESFKHGRYDYDEGEGTPSEVGEGELVITTVEEVEFKIPKRIQQVAGPTNPLSSRRIIALKPTKFNEEPLQLACEWDLCDFETRELNSFMNHVNSHIPDVELVQENENAKSFSVYLKCNWRDCPYRIHQSEDLTRHLFLHAYHTKLKCIGTNTLERSSINPCRADSSNRNILPDLSENLVCAWENCSETFINIQYYYDHIRLHCEDNLKGKNVPGGIHCLWAGCEGVFQNISKLRDHMRSHTQEKLLACPTCGGLFSNRTRFFDHCRRQNDDQNFACNVCMKTFSTARLLRDHIRSHVNTYRCNHCDMSCSSPSALVTHIKYRHHEEKPYPCPQSQCDYSAKSSSDLTRHIKIHTKQVHKCDDCDYEAKAISSLTHHYTTTHGENRDQKYLCHICDEKMFIRGYYLTKHLISAHNLAWPSGHKRFRYKLHEDGFYRLLTLRYESIDAQNSEDVDVD